MRTQVFRRLFLEPCCSHPGSHLDNMFDSQQLVRPEANRRYLQRSPECRRAGSSKATGCCKLPVDENHKHKRITSKEL